MKEAGLPGVTELLGAELQAQEFSHPATQLHSIVGFLKHLEPEQFLVESLLFLEVDDQEI